MCIAVESRRSMKQNPKILVITDTQSDNDWAALEGIASYNKLDEWLLRNVELHQDLPRVIQSWKPNGIIFTARAKTVRDIHLPKVSLFNFSPEKGLCSVEIHQENTGKLAAEFLLNKGFRNLVFITGTMLPRATRRYHEFLKTAQARGLQPRCFENHCEHGMFPDEELQENIDRMGQWLSWQPRPLAVFTVNDLHALHVLEACRRHNIKVPEDAAVLGADDNHRLCAIAHPSLSSIQLPYKQLGFEAARLLDAQLQNKPIQQQHITLDPIGIIERQSTEIFGINDEAVVKALRYVRQHRTEPIRILEVVRHSGVSRTLLQRKFQETLNRTLLEEIHRQKMELATDLLQNTLLSIDEIAEKCGLSDQAQFTKLFRRKIGITPSAYRKKSTAVI